MTTGRRAVRSAVRTAPRSAGGRARSASPCGDGGSRRGRVEVEVDGAGRPGQAQRDRRPHVRCGRRRAEDERALGDRTEQRGVVEALVGDTPAVRGRHAVADEQEGLAVEQGVCDAVHRAGGARTAGDDAGARAAGELGRGRGHEHRRALGVGEDEAEPLGLGRPDDVEVATAAGQPEQDLDPRVAQAGGDQLRDRPAHRTPLSAARAIRSLRSLIELRSRPLGPFALSARSSNSALGRSGHSLSPLAHRTPLSAARAIRSLRSLIELRSRPLGPFALSARSSRPARGRSRRRSAGRRRPASAP